ncbi:hypothetical protein G7054_g3489 [Neopestalotiopsis clavispora]|nr:hypothetical protein G7054_g3489 [Neopestalotiopsis clavispora]
MDYGVDIYRAAEFCGANFDACLADPVLKDYVVALHSAQGDFNLWCSAIKATSQGKASLDYRLRNHQDVRDTVCQLLAALAASLKRWATQAAAMHADVESYVGLAVDTTKEMPDSPTSTDSPASWDAISDEWSNADSDRGENTTVRDPIIGECMFYAKTILDQLARLSLAIRKAGNKFRFEKIDSQLKDEAYEPFRNHLASVVLRAFPDPDAERLSAEEKMKRVANYGGLTPIQKRLVHVNILRRHRIEFVTKSRKDKRPNTQDIGLIKDSRRLDETQSSRASSVPRAQTSRQTLESISSQLAKREFPKDAHTPSVAPGSAPTATDVDSRIDVKRFLNTPSSSNITKVTKIGTSQFYPDRPKPGANGLLICSYCDDVLPSSYEKGEQSWRAHVAQDLMPYSCFIDGCETPYEMYLTSENLLGHVMDKHSTSCWTCNFCRPGDYNDGNSLHITLDFWSAEEWINHVTEAHSGQIRVAQLSVLASLSKRSVLGTLACPFCDFASGTMVSSIDDHILQHLHEFSLRALPEIFDTNADDRSKASQLSGSLSHVKEVEHKDSQYPLEYSVVDETQWISMLETLRSFHSCQSLEKVTCRVLEYLKHHYSVFDIAATTEFWSSQMMKVSNVLETIYSTPGHPSEGTMSKDMLENIVEHTSADILDSLDLSWNKVYQNIAESQRIWRFSVPVSPNISLSARSIWRFSVPESPNIPLSARQKGVKDDVDYHLFEQKSILYLNSGSQPKQQPRVLLTGSSGTGKTLIAGEVARQTFEQGIDFSVFWIPATSLSSVSHAYSQILKPSNISYENRDPERYLAYWLNWLLLDKWLMVLDGIDGQTLQHMQSGGWLPSGIGGRLLLTSEDPSCAGLLGQVTEIRLPSHAEKRLPFQVIHALAPSRPEDFDVAVICQSLAEYDAMITLFDELWEEDPRYFGQSSDSAFITHTLHSARFRGGQICGSNAVLALEPDPTSEAVATEIRRSFKGVQLALLVGNCSGLPEGPRTQVRRGDILISDGTVAYQSLDASDQSSLNIMPFNDHVNPVVAALNLIHGIDKIQRDTAFFLELLQAPSHEQSGDGDSAYSYPGATEDKLFMSSYQHKHRNASNCACNNDDTFSMEVCQDAMQSSCDTLGCESQYLVGRAWTGIEDAFFSYTKPHDPYPHSGTVAILDRMPRSPIEWQKVSSHHAELHTVPGFMVGWRKVVEHLPCVTVHGVRDYGDGHGSSQWTTYAAAAAASAATAILGVYNRMAPCIVPLHNTHKIPDNEGLVDEIKHRLSEIVHSSGKMIILGPRGSGKTFLALLAVNTFRSRNPERSVFWVSARSTKALDDGFRGVGRRLRPSRFSEFDLQPGEDSTSRVLDTLNRPDDSNWLLIIDDVSLDIPDILADWLQSDPQGSVLLISRDRGSARLFQIPVKNVITVPATQLRDTIVHELAVGNQTYGELSEKWEWGEDELQSMLSMVANKLGDKFSMKPYYWKELDVWNYKYEPLEHRQKAIENAKRQYDKLRLETTHEAWERLLEEKDRGKGIVLSKLPARVDTSRTAVPVEQTKGRESSYEDVHQNRTHQDMEDSYQQHEREDTELQESVQDERGKKDKEQAKRAEEDAIQMQKVGSKLPRDENTFDQERGGQSDTDSDSAEIETKTTVQDIADSGPLAGLAIPDEAEDGAWGYLFPRGTHASHISNSAIVLRKRTAINQTGGMEVVAGAQVKKSYQETLEKHEYIAANQTPTAGFLIGRHTECDFVIDEPVVSNRHCLIFAESKGQEVIAVIQDLSSNGTFVNEVLIGQNQRRELIDQDKIWITNDEHFVFRYPPSRTPSVFLQQYTLLERLGKGHFAEVFLCVKKSSGQRYAVKIFTIRPVDARSTIDALQREIAMFMGIVHPNILRVEDAFIEENAVYIVMELATEGELFNWIVMKQKFTEPEARELFLQLFGGVKHLHDRNIVHRDIKPENILVIDKDLHVKIADFGLSIVVGGEAFTTTLCGTPSYVAPEVLADDRIRKYTKAVDVWSLGVVLYISLCGFPPFSDELYTKEFPYTLSQQIRDGRFDYPSPYWDSVGDPALDLIDRMLVVDPEKRFTIDECLDHPWVTQKMPDELLPPSRRGSRVEGLDVPRHGIGRERTMLSTINDINIDDAFRDFDQTNTPVQKGEGSGDLARHGFVAEPDQI